MKQSGMSFYVDMFICLVAAAISDLVATCWASNRKTKTQTQYIMTVTLIAAHVNVFNLILLT